MSLPAVLKALPVKKRKADRHQHSKREAYDVFSDDDVDSQYPTDNSERENIDLANYAKKISKQAKVKKIQLIISIKWVSTLFINYLRFCSTFSHRSDGSWTYILKFFYRPRSWRIHASLSMIACLLYDKKTFPL